MKAGAQKPTDKQETRLGDAKENIRTGRFDDAEKILDHLIKEKETAEAHRHLAIVYRAQGQGEKAMASLEQALDLDENDHASIALIGELYFDRNDARQAVGHYVLAIEASPETFFYKKRFIELAGQTLFFAHNETMQKTLLACLRTENLDCSGAQTLWYSLLVNDPEFKPFYKFSNAGSFVAFNQKAFDRIKNLKPILRPFFIHGLEKIVVHHPVFEEFLVHLRHVLLKEFASSSPKFTRQELARILAALSRYCHHTEYIFPAMPEEEAWISDLRRRLETDSSAVADEAAVALYACYAPLHGLKIAEDLLLQHQSGDLSKLIDLQVREWKELRDIRQSIKPLTEISSGISDAVREQYEEFPYPRWMSVSPVRLDKEVELRLSVPQPKILVAGCGTGSETVKLKYAFPDANILSVDLSLSSLSYAIYKARRLGFKDLDFYQADILRLGGIKERFDCVCSSGVLHHMEDPMQGWKILRGLLKDDGLMRIALYSKTARRNLIAAQELIRKKGFTPDAAGMKAFRRQAHQLLDREVAINIAALADAYYLSEYRDLLFHVQEHRFDIPGLQAAFDELGLKFMGFSLPEVVMQAYRQKFPHDPKGLDLASWHQFEQENPHTFISMYQFWCGPKEG